MKLEGGRTPNSIAGLEPSGGTSDYYVGNRNAWHTGVPHFAKLRETSVYDGVDVLFNSRGSDFEYDFVVQPGADPKKIQLAFTGADRLRIDHKSGDLLVTAARGSQLREGRPEVYQQIGNKRVAVAGRYELLDGSHVKFALGVYDHTAPLIIDPVVALIQTNFGQYGGNSLEGVAVDESGDIYVTGTDVNLGTDVFITRLTPQGAAYKSTYLGGSGVDVPAAIAFDGTSLYICGQTTSMDFPELLGKKQDTSSDIFVAKLDAFLDLEWVTSRDSPGNEFALYMALDPYTHNVYVVGGTDDPQQFPEFGPIPPQRPQGFGNGAVAIHVDASGSLVNSLSLGPDTATAITVDYFGGIWVTGQTCYPSFYPITVANSATLEPGTCSGYLTRFAPDFAEVTVARLFAYGTAITTDLQGNVYAAGNGNGGGTPLVAKFDNNGNPLAKFEFHGTNGQSTFTSIAVNSGAEVYLSGYTSSTTFPGTTPYSPNPLPQGYTLAFLSKVSSALNQPLWTELGGGSSSTGIAVRETQPWVAGQPQIYSANNAYAPVGPPFLANPRLIRWSDDPGPYQAFEGKIMKSSADPRVYFICSGQKRWIPDETTFTALGFDWSQLMVNDVANSIPAGVSYPSLPTGKTFRDPVSARVYLLQDGVRRWIPDATTFEKMGLDWNNVVIITPLQLNAIPLGAPMPVLQ